VNSAVRDDIVQVLRDPARLEALFDHYGVAETVTHLEQEGVAAYLAWLRPEISGLTPVRHRSAIVAELQARQLRLVCAALLDAGVQPVLFKGAATAHTDYPAPWCRPMVDLDLLIAPPERTRAFAVLTELGYAQPDRIAGEWVSGQQVFERPIGGLTVSVDVHWRVSNRIWLSSLLPETRLRERAVAAPFVGPGVLRAADQDAMLIACLHPAAHHPKNARLVWALDVVRLAGRITPPVIDGVVAACRAAGVSATLAQALRDAAALAPVRATMPPILQPVLVDRIAASAAVERSPVSDQPDRDQLQDAIDDLRALPEWGARLRLMREHLFPAPEFMLRTHGNPSSLALPWLYTRRLVVGGWQWTAQWARDRVISRRADRS
jgi:hypothetical protein